MTTHAKQNIIGLALSVTFLVATLVGLISIQAPPQKSATIRVVSAKVSSTPPATPIPLIGASFCANRPITYSGSVLYSDQVVTELRGFGFNLVPVDSDAMISIRYGKMTGNDLGVTRYIDDSGLMTSAHISVEPGAPINVVRHEFGHALGLDHALAAQPSVMQPDINLPRARNDFTPDDMAALRTLLAHTC